LFGSGSNELNRRAAAELHHILPGLPLIVVSEFEIEGAGEWIPYNFKRGASENLDFIRARLGERKVALSAVVLDPKSPYRSLRWIGFRLAPGRFLAFNENLNHFMLRPGSAITIGRHFEWRAKNFLRYHFKHGGFFYTWYWRLRQPVLLKRPLLYRAALAAGRLASLLKAGSPRATSPSIGQPLPDGVSVVVPSRDGRELLSRMLPPVLAQLNPERSEIIVVDNGSADGTEDWLRTEHPGVKVAVSDSPLSFARAVNIGINQAAYSHLCLLNNDMIVEPGFFAALRAAFAKVPDLFCATAQIFLPEGARREETGKTAFPLERPREGFPIRCEIPVDGEDHTWVLYGSGGCSLYDTRKLRALGSAGEVFEPAYVEDLDLGFRAWRLHWPSVFAARARVLHQHRATTSRYYSESDLAVVLERNYLRFLTRAITSRALYSALWRETIDRVNLTATHNDLYANILRSALAAPGWLESQPRAELAEREILALGSGDVAVFPGRPPTGNPVVLVVSPYVPFPLSHGGAVRMFNLMQRGAREFDQVLICFTGDLQPVPPEMLEICVEVIYVRRRTTHALPASDRPDVVEEFDSPVFRAALHQAVRKWKPPIAQLEFTQMAQYAADCKPARTLLVEHDITLDLYAQLLRQRDDWETRRQFEKWVRFEHQAWGQIDRIVTMSEKDRLAVGRAHAVALPNGVDLRRFQPSAEDPEPRRILFIGSFQHLPNVLALEFFLREVWPPLEASGCTLHVIAGSKPEFYLERYKDRAHLDLNRRGLELEGFVSDVRPAYRRAAIVVAPLLASAGTNIKIMEALAMGKAVVSTPAGINGLHELENGRDVIVVISGAEMAAAIQSLMADPERRALLEHEARRTAREKFDWDIIAESQAALYRSLVAVDPDIHSK
jgi:glycosyltransferase involved in cell wall biosynthesis/GT2 family glycosyltransferase